MLAKHDIGEHVTWIVLAPISSSVKTNTKCCLYEINKLNNGVLMSSLQGEHKKIFLRVHFSIKWP